MDVTEIRRVSATRTRAIRQALGLSGEAFSSIFATMQQKYVSRWERAQKHPDTEQLEELLTFLQDPRPWMAKEGPHANREGKVYATHPHVAILYFPWGDPDELELVELGEAPPALRKMGVPFREPRFAARRDGVFGLEKLVMGITDPTITDEDWRGLLLRCSYPWSKRPFERVSLLSKVDPVKQLLELRSLDEEMTELLISDHKVHGNGVVQALSRPRKLTSEHLLKDLQRVETENQAKLLLEGCQIHLMTLVSPDLGKHLLALGSALNDQPEAKDSHALEVSEEDRRAAQQRLTLLNCETAFHQGAGFSDSKKWELFQRLTASEGFLTGLEAILTTARVDAKSFDEEILETAWRVIRDWRRINQEVRNAP